MATGKSAAWASTATLALSVACSAFGAELFVNPSGANGAHTTIQAAVDAAAEGDIVTVAPGTYASGGKAYSWTQTDGTTYSSTDRVWISKRIHLRSSGGASVTKIQGGRDSDNADLKGVGPKAVRCVHVSPDAVGTVIEGFTFQLGSAHAAKQADGTTDIGDIEASRAGGVLAGDSSSGAGIYVVDCVFSSCTGGHGGALRYGTAIRCSFSVSQATVSANVAGDSVLVNCLVAHNYCTTAAALHDVTLVNCSVCANGTSDSATQHVLDGTSRVYNSVIAGNTLAPLGSPSTTTIEGSFVSPDMGAPYQFFAPLFDDFRLVAHSQSVGIADPARLAGVSTSGAVAAIDLYKDFSGAAILRTGAINAGCVQATVQPAGGAVQFNRAVTANGYQASTSDRHLWAFSETPQDVFRVVGAQGQPLYWTSLNDGKPIWPERDGSLWCVMPPVGMVITNSIEYPYYRLYVSTTGDDNANGTWMDTPFRSIQRAIDVAESDDKTALVFVKAGDYDYGATTNSEHGISRVVLGSRRIRILGEGADRTTIWGELDTTAQGLANEGRGTNGVRCVCFGRAWGCVQGFTLRRGRAQAGTENNDKNMGGLALAPYNIHPYEGNVLSDCVLEDGAASRSSAASRCKLIRCTIRNCVAYGGAIVRPGTLDTCEIWSGGATSDGYMFEATMYGCTVVATNAGITAYNSGLPSMQNCVFSGSAAYQSYFSANAVCTGNVCWNTRYQEFDSGNPLRNVKADPLFVDSANGDCRVLAASPAFTCGVLTNDYWKYSQSGIDGKPRVYVDGKTLAGARQGSMACLNVDSSRFAADCTVSQNGFIPVAPGESVTVTAALREGSLRQLNGFLVNGEAVPSSPASYTYTAPADGSYDVGGITVVPNVTADWFVKPDGDDSANGWTTNTAKRTLAHVMSLTYSGDVVHALPGTYAEGVTNMHSLSFLEGNGSATSSRVVVPTNVTLVAESGPESTVIKGQEATSDFDVYGCGPGGVRCATVLSGGVLKGFTLTGGRTGVAYNYSTANDDRDGGAVLAPKDDDTAVISGCIISNNACARGTCAGGHLKNCRIVENKAGQTSGGLWHASASGCLFDRNLCGASQLMRHYGRIENCTLGSGNKYTDGSDLNKTLDDPLGPLVNCVVLTKFSTACTATNCVFVENSFKTNEQSRAITVLSSAADALLDENGVPLSGSPLIDAGDASASSTLLAESDYYGVRRFYNGALDVGAYEYDWRPVYRAILGKPSSMADLDTSPYVVAGNENVAIPDGSALTCVLAPISGVAPFKCVFEAEVAGNGNLTVTINGEEVLVIPGTNARTTYSIKCADAAAAMSFSYDGAGSARLYGLTAKISGMTIYIR